MRLVVTIVGIDIERLEHDSQGERQFLQC